jgi:hypothetical protein
MDCGDCGDVPAPSRHPLQSVGALSNLTFPQLSGIFFPPAALFPGLTYGPKSQSFLWPRLKPYRNQFSGELAVFYYGEFASLKHSNSLQ